MKLNWNKKNYILAFSIILSILYMVINLCIYRFDNYLATFIMTAACFICVYYSYDWSTSFFSINNLFIVIFFAFGNIFRFLIIGLRPERAMIFAYNKLELIDTYHTLTAIIVLISIISLTIGYRCIRKLPITKLSIDSSKIDYKLLYIIFYVLCALIYVYKIINTRVVVRIDFGIYDNIINMLSILIRYIAYISLCLYLQNKKKFHLYAVLAYEIPNMGFSLISGWKGLILFELIFLLVLIATYRKIKAVKYVIFLGLLFVIIYPIISLYRYNLAAGYTMNSINLHTILKFSKNNNVFYYLSDRFSYYDYIYYATNISDSIKNTFLDNAGYIHEKFISGLVPRVLYKDKAIVNVGLEIPHYLMGYPKDYYNNLTVTYVGEILISYKIIGVVIFNFIIGLLMKIIEKRRRKINFYTAEYVIIGSWIIGLFEGDIAAKTIGILPTIIFIALVNNFFSFKNSNIRIKEVYER